MKKIIPERILNYYHYLMPHLGAFIYRWPSKKMIVIGVTGTKGKTTVCNLIADILNYHGYKTGLATTVNFGIGKEKWVNKTKQTMQGRMRLQKLMRRMVDENCMYAVIEVSSEGILQHRHEAIKFDVAVFTNLSPEHIERHGSFENYLKAKLELFKTVSKKKEGVGVFNMDDKNIGDFLKQKIEKKLGYSMSENVCRCDVGMDFSMCVEEHVLEGDRIIFKANGVRFEVPFMGLFNIYNALAAICAVHSQGISLEKVSEALKAVRPVPGRMEYVQRDPFAVIVDYAHEPASLEAALKASRQISKNKLICLIGGQGGGRDKWKREEMGRVAAGLCDYIIVSNEDPYDENPLEIMKGIKTGVLSVGFGEDKIFDIEDRREGIRKALSLASVGDVVITTGKGGESWICMANGEKIPWNEVEVVRSELKSLEMN